MIIINSVSADFIKNKTRISAEIYESHEHVDVLKYKVIVTLDGQYTESSEELKKLVELELSKIELI